MECEVWPIHRARFAPQTTATRRYLAFGRSIAWQGIAQQCPEKVVVKIKGRKFWLWCAVDKNGVVLDEILQRGRDKNAALRLLRRLMNRQERSPKRFITPSRDIAAQCTAGQRTS